MVEPTKKDILHPKKPQQESMRGIIMIKSNSKPPKWVTHKLENFITEVLWKKWNFWAPYQAPQPGGLAMGGGGPRESAFESQWGLITRIPLNVGKQKLHSWRAHKTSCVHQPRGKAVTSEEPRPDLLLVLESLLRRQGGCGLLWEQRHWWW